MKKFIATVVLCVSVASVSLVASAARDQGAACNDKLAYDYSLKSPWLWGDVKGYSNSTFIVDYSVIKAGFDGYSSINIKSDDGLAGSNKTVRVKKGTNYAETGNVTVDGYSGECSSTHRSWYTQGGVSHSGSLSVD